MAVVGSLPSWLDVDFVRNAAGGLAIMAMLIVLLVMFMIRSLGARLVVIAMMGAAVFGLLHYRTVLERCDRNGCECKFFGENLRGGACAPSR